MLGRRYYWFDGGLRNMRGDLANAARHFRVRLGPRVPFKIVSFYTVATQYEDHAKRLIASTCRHSLDCEIEPIASSGVWEWNCALKASFIRSKWEISDRSVVWLDADATVERYPQLFHMPYIDIAFHLHKGRELLSGTLLFGKTPAARALLDDWCDRCAADPGTWDQKHLSDAWHAAKGTLRTLFLPRAYCQIFDKPHRGRPIIRHWQASRIEKASGRSLANHAT